MYGNENHKPRWGWNWLEQWMASQPYHGRHLMMPRDTRTNSYMTMTMTSADDMSEKTVEMDFVDIKPNRTSFAGGGDPVAELSPYINKLQSSPYVPSYMAPTQSAKAKVRSQDLIKHRSPSSSKRGGVVNGITYDSSSSGGRTTVATYQPPKSPNPNPNPKGNAASRFPPKWIGAYSPDSSSEDRVPLPLGTHGFRHNFV